MPCSSKKCGVLPLDDRGIGRKLATYGVEGKYGEFADTESRRPPFGASRFRPIVMTGGSVSHRPGTPWQSQARVGSALYM
jgi:hypothetical protein